VVQRIMNLLADSPSKQQPRSSRRIDRDRDRKNAKPYSRHPIASSDRVHAKVPRKGERRARTFAFDPSDGLKVLPSLSFSFHPRFSFYRSNIGYAMSMSIT